MGTPSPSSNPMRPGARRVTGAVAWLWDKQLGHATLLLKAGMVFLPGGVAVLVYWLIALWLKVPAAQEMTDLALQRFRKAKKG